MPRLQFNSDVGKITDSMELSRYLSIALRNIVDVINGNVEFDLNIRSKTVSVDFTEFDTDFPIQHNLNRIPTGYLIASCDIPTRIYNVKDSDVNYVYLRASDIATVKVIIF